MTHARSLRVVAGVMAALVAMMLAIAGPAFAADSARIQDVQTQEGQVVFLLTAAGLTPGERLDASTVQVAVDGKPVPATTGEAVNVQRTVYLVMDTSGSMEGEPLAAAKAAGEQYLDTVPADVAVGLITFADAASVAVPATTDRAAVVRALDAARAEGDTALFDAAVLATEQLGTEGARSIVLLSDGEDEGSTATEAQAISALTTSGVALDAVALSAGLGVEQLNRMALASGGTVVQAGSTEQLAEAFESAALSTAGQVLVTAQLPAGQQPGTVPITASVRVGDDLLADEAIVVIDPQTAADAAAASAEAVGPVPVATRTIGVLQQSWFLPLAVLVIFTALATISLLAFRLITDEALQPRRVQRRMADYGVSAATGSEVYARGESALAQRAVAVAQEVVEKRDPDQKLERKLAAAGIPLKPSEWAVLHVSIALSTALILAALTGLSLLWTIVGLAVGGFLPYAVLDIKATSRRKEFYKALPDVLQLLAGSVASGYSFPQAVDTVASQTTGVVATEFNRAVAESRLGIQMEDALDDVADRMDSKDFEWVVMAVRINRRVGGNLSEVLRTVAKTLRERERLRRQVSALTAEGRLSAIIIGALPFFLAFYLAVVNPEYIGLLLTNPIGWVMVLGALVLVAVGIVWMKNTIKLEV